jgi:hypothetical protein
MGTMLSNLREKLMVANQKYKNCGCKIYREEAEGLKKLILELEAKSK